MSNNEQTNDGRLTIGLAADDIVMVGGQNALRGAVDAAREHDVNLFCFHQRILDLPKRTAYCRYARSGHGMLMTKFVHRTLKFSLQITLSRRCL